MSKAKFQVIIDNIDEETLGPMLGRLAVNTAFHINVLREEPVKPVPAVKLPGAFSDTLPVRRPSLAEIVKSMPQQFQAKDFIPVLEAHGRQGGSISHFLRQAMDKGLITKVGSGNKTAYRKTGK